MDVICCSFFQNHAPEFFVSHEFTTDFREDEGVWHQQKGRVPMETVILIGAYINTQAHKNCQNNGYLMTGF